jgi:hypothetical protein
MEAHTAHAVAGDPDLYNRVILIGRSHWECLGYSRTGRRVKFARLVDAPGYGTWGLRQIVKYVDPDQVIEVYPPRINPNAAD